MMNRMTEGRAQEREIDMLQGGSALASPASLPRTKLTSYCIAPPIELTKQVEGHTICALGDAAAWPIQLVPARLTHYVTHGPTRLIHSSRLSFSPPQRTDQELPTRDRRANRQVPSRARRRRLWWSAQIELPYRRERRS